MNEEELKEEIEEIREEQKILCRRYSSEEEDDNLIMKDQRRLDKGYNKRINQILKERSSWYNIALEVDEILIILLKARLEGFQKGKLEQKKEDIKLINNLKNPYPRDVFTEPSKEQWDKLQILFEDNNLTQDRYFGSFGRLVFNNIIKQLKKEIGGMK